MNQTARDANRIVEQDLQKISNGIESRVPKKHLDFLGLDATVVGSKIHPLTMLEIRLFLKEPR